MTASITILHAGSLTGVIQQGLGPVFLAETGIAVQNKGGHSVALATAMKEGITTGDVYMSADAATNRVLMGPENGEFVRWFVVFARNAAVLAYSPRSRHADDFLRASRGEANWYDILCRPDVQIGRADPNLDPMAYYTLFICALAETYYQIPGLKQRILGDDVNPAQIGRLSPAALTSGEIDAIFLYRTAALSMSLPYLALPKEINLSEPAYAATYAAASFTTNLGQTFRGVPIRFSAAPVEDAANSEGAERFLAFLTSPAGQAIVQEHHFLPSPILVGGDRAAVPASIQPAIQGDFPPKTVP